MQSPTLGASYTSSPKLGGGTRLGRSMSNEEKRPLEWGALQAVVLPMCSGKSTYALRYGGYDIDDVVVNTGELKIDDECDRMLELREAAVWRGEREGLHEHNEILLKRARRFLEICSPDSNAPIVYIHTVELADALGLPILACIELDEQIIRETKRFKNASLSVQGHTLTIAREQAAANAVYLQRAGYGTPRRCRSFFELDAYLDANIGKHISQNSETKAMIEVLTSRMHEREKLDALYAYVKRSGQPDWAKAVASRNLVHALGDAAPQEAHHHHNHPGWARYIHAVYSRVPRSVPGDWHIRSITEDYVRERFPMGPGSSSFALFDISSWLRHTPESAWLEGWHWARQLLSHPQGATYERLAATIVMGDALSYAKPQYGEICSRLPLGLLNTEEFSVVTQHAHALVRAGCNYLGRKLPTADLALFTYWHCLVGRHLGKLDVEKEISDRTSVRAPKFWYFPDGRKSSSEFSRRLRGAISRSYQHLGVVAKDKLLTMEEDMRTLESFLRIRKSWVKPGSATGAPKTDLYLTATVEKEALAKELGAELLDATHLVIRKMRLNKAATFEFPEFPQLVQEALDKFEPTSFTRYFTKYEVGKLEGRALFPANMMHYIVTSYILFLAEKGGSMPNTRLNAPADQQLLDHWLWHDTRDYVFGLMLDYANFNEQHEIEHMQMVIGELQYYYSKHDLLSDSMRQAFKWVMDSFDAIVFEVDGKGHKFNHGLLSGWRCTSWVNSILNVAYMDVIAQQVHQMTGIRVLTSAQTGGDDVAATTASLYDAVVVLRVGEAMGFEFKAIKQLMGSKYVEFYRLFVSSDGVRGSLCRMLGSAVSGQWSNSVIAKFVEPASKLNSVVEIARKAGRRCELNMSIMEKMTLCAFEKWARHDDIEIARELIHGTVATGGLGVPTPAGDVYELEQAGVPARADSLEIIGLPHDASDVSAERITTAVRDLLGKEAAMKSSVLAEKMSRSVFIGAAATARGPRLAQRLQRRVDYTRKPRITRIKRVRPEDVRARHNTMLRHRLDEHKELIRSYTRAKNRFDFLRAGTVDSYAEPLAMAVAKDNVGVDPLKLIRWRERNTLYGCATYMLTEDYYDAVITLAVIESKDGDEDEVSRIAAGYAKGLSEEGYTFY
ncbi:127 kDa protein [Penicillium janczewskii chrysovirus 1]|uniref:RNA-directed RNA polymerase n=1 Tax=Penicillium janczewskii chrysovirus 1 TaxID=1755792 RepID=A0A0S2KPB7_9VIRU|nr:127 kDa protein [Penicillium janczewskii chrysovirus 1]ALO50142.1 127 kDa protein [Penicillium janczewskii chrysovirus 1]